MRLVFIVSFRSNRNTQIKTTQVNINKTIKEKLIKNHLKLIYFDVTQETK